MKKKCILLLSVIVLMMILIPSVKATEEEVSHDDEIMLINETNSYDDEVMPINEKARDIEFIEKDSINEDVYSVSESLEKKSEIVNGNMYLFTNSVYIENEIINGDLYICASTVKIDNSTLINGNVYICAMNVKIDANITRGIYVCAKDVIFDENTSVQYDANIFAERVIIKGSFDRQVNTCVDNLEISNTANIRGNLNYISDKEAKIEDKAIIANINFAKQEIKKETVLDIVYKYVLKFTKYFVLTFGIFIFMMKVLPNFINNSRKYIGISSFGLGILAIILMPIIFIGMMLIKFTASLAILGVVVFIAMLLVAITITNISIASAISNKCEKLKLPISVVLTAIVSWIIYQIPFIGGIIAFIMIATGVGIVIKYLFIKQD